jgi:hypothetical protein
MFLLRRKIDPGILSVLPVSSGFHCICVHTVDEQTVQDSYFVTSVLLWAVRNTVCCIPVKTIVVKRFGPILTASPNEVT